MQKLPYAETQSYWQTSKSSPETWLERTRKLIASIGGTILSEAFGREGEQSAYMLAFEIKGDRFKIVWPVLPSRGNNAPAARVQAVTFMYHDIKTKCDKISIFGARIAFFEYLQLPDGRVASTIANPELAREIPAMFRPQGPALGAGGDVVDGEFQEL